MEPNQDSGESDTSDVNEEDVELDSGQKSESSTDPEKENDGSVSDLWKVVRGISEVLARLEKSNTKPLSHVGGKRSDTASVTSAQKSKQNAKTKSDESTSSDLHDLMAESGNFDEMQTPPINLNPFNGILMVPTNKRSVVTLRSLFYCLCLFYFTLGTTIFQ